MAKILIITPKSPSTNPRMRKAADALAAAGHNVHVLWAYGTEWADVHDRVICANAKWSSEQIGGNPTNERGRYFFSRLMRKTWEVLGIIDRSFCRSYSSYVRRGVRWNPELVIGHNPGALGPLRALKQKLGVPVLFDAEDFHRGETATESSASRRVSILEDRCLPILEQATAASPLIAEAYSELYPSIRWTVVNNAFTLKRSVPRPAGVGEGPLRVIWFSQVVGLDRGLEEFMAGLAVVPEIPVQVSIIGTCTEAIQSSLSAFVASAAHELQFHQPLSEEALFEFIGQHELGLALEIPMTRNRDLCRTNKLYTYPICGTYMLASHTAAQAQFLSEFPETGTLIDLKDPHSIAAELREAYRNRAGLLRKRIQAWEAGQTKLNWEVESVGLLKIVNGILN